MTMPLIRPIVQVVTIDLSVAHSNLQVAVNAPRFFVPQVDFPATIRLSDSNSQALPLQSGMWESSEGGLIDFVYITNDVGPAGAVALIAPIENVKIVPQGSINATGALKVETTPQRGALIDHSGTTPIAPGATVISGVNLVRKYFLFQNLSVGSLYLEIGAHTGAGPGSILVLANGSVVFEGNFVPTAAIWVHDPAGSSPFTAKEA